MITPPRLAHAVRRSVIGVGILAAQAAAALTLSKAPAIGIVAAIALLGGLLLLVYPGVGLAAALALCFAASRVGPAKLDMSIADATLVVASIAALPHVPWASAAVRRVMAVGALYVTMLSLNILIVPHRSAVIELGHRSFLVLGSLVVGSAIAHRNRTVLALRCFLTTATGFGIAAVITTLGDGYKPAYVFGYHKNFIGPLLMMALLVSVAAATTVRIPPALLNLSRVCMSAGLVATQSRAAIIGGGCAFIIWAIRSGKLTRYLPLLTVVLGAATYFVSLTVSRDTADKSNYQFNTVGSRVKVYEIALRLWQEHPIFGYGVRWFRDPAAPTTEPHSSLIATLSETGLWGILSILLLFGLTMLLLSKRRGPLPLAAFAVLAARLLESQLAIFWVAGTMTLPWLLAGLAMATPEPAPALVTKPGARVRT
jgi:polysaccharide biosynthesis protein PslJ